MQTMLRILEMEYERDSKEEKDKQMAVSTDSQAKLILT